MKCLLMFIFVIISCLSLSLTLLLCKLNVLVLSQQNISYWISKWQFAYWILTSLPWGLQVCVCVFFCFSCDFSFYSWFSFYWWWHFSAVSFLFFFLVTLRAIALVLLLGFTWLLANSMLGGDGNSLIRSLFIGKDVMYIGWPLYSATIYSQWQYV